MDGKRPHGDDCLRALEDVATLYAAHAARVRRLVHLSVTASDELVEDSCQLAWLRLLAHRDRVRRDGAVRWLVRVARNEVVRCLARARPQLTLEVLEDSESGAVPAPPLIDELAAHRARLESIDALPVRQRRLVWLQGLGFSYAEMAGQTGDSPRTIERQLLRAKHRLAERDAA